MANHNEAAIEARLREAIGDARATAAIFRAFLQRGVVGGAPGLGARAAALAWPQSLWEPGEPSRAAAEETSTIAPPAK